jgi:hypothetical protein
MRKLVPTAPIAGNLALKLVSESVSATEAGYGHELESSTAPSRSIPLRFATDALEHCLFFSELYPESTEMYSDQLNMSFCEIDPAKSWILSTDNNFATRLASSSTGQQDSFTASAHESFARSMIVTFAAATTTETCLLRDRSDDLIDNFTFGNSLEPCLLTRPIHLLNHSPEVLEAKFNDLHKEFGSWPGSYNQLLLAGSLDYCRSAVRRAKKNGIELPREVLECLKAYYVSCLSLFDQYQDSKTAFRRINLQSIQDKFENLQLVCDQKGIYPRLDELNLEDVPADQ